MHSYAVVAVSWALTVIGSLGAFFAGLVPSAFVMVVSLIAMAGVLGFALGYSVERRRLLMERIARIRLRASLR